MNEIYCDSQLCTARSRNEKLKKSTAQVAAGVIAFGVTSFSKQKRVAIDVESAQQQASKPRKQAQRHKTLAIKCRSAECEARKENGRSAQSTNRWGTLGQSQQLPQDTADGQRMPRFCTLLCRRCAGSKVKTGLFARREIEQVVEMLLNKIQFVFSGFRLSSEL